MESGISKTQTNQPIEKIFYLCYNFIDSNKSDKNTEERR